MDLPLPRTPSDVLPVELLVLDALEGHAHQIAASLLAETGPPDFYKRLRDGRFLGVGTQRLLLHLGGRVFKWRVDDLVDFYQTCTRPDDDPHYEDIATTLLLAVITGILGNACYGMIASTLRHRRDLFVRVRRHWDSFASDALLTYRFLSDAWYLRQELWTGSTKRSAHDAKLLALRSRWRQRLQEHRQEAGSCENRVDTTDDLAARIVALVRDHLQRHPETIDDLRNIFERDETNDSDLDR